MTFVPALPLNLIQTQSERQTMMVVLKKKMMSIT